MCPHRSDSSDQFCKCSCIVLFFFKMMLTLILRRKYVLTHSSTVISTKNFYNGHWALRARRHMARSIWPVTTIAVKLCPIQSQSRLSFMRISSTHRKTHSNCETRNELRLIMLSAQTGLVRSLACLWLTIRRWNKLRLIIFSTCMV